jgi:extracellular elastinolytic metalloproteinase
MGAFGNSFVQPSQITANTPTVSVEDAIATAEEALDGKHNGFEPQIQYLVLQDGSAALVHVVQIESDSAQTTYQAYVHALTRELLSVVDFTAHASYYVLPITKETPDEGFQTLKDPHDLKASPKGWHDNGSGSSNATSGNNAISFAGPSAETTSQSGANLVFNYHYDVKKEPTVAVNMNASRTNAFYIVNSMHDIWYRYGFNEEAANFQANNFGKGGKGGDAVQVSVQDSLGMNNAGFTTFPEYVLACSILSQY